MGGVEEPTTLAPVVAPALERRHARQGMEWTWREWNSIGLAAPGGAQGAQARVIHGVPCSCE